MDPEKVTNEEMLELECIGEETRKKETAGEEKDEPPRKFTVKVLAETFADLSKRLRKFENMDPQHQKVCIIREECS